MSYPTQPGMPPPPPGPVYAPAPPYQGAPPPPYGGRPPGPNFTLSLLILLIGIGLGITSAVGIGTTVVHALNGIKVLTTPGQLSDQLSAGTYVVYELEGLSTNVNSPATTTPQITPVVIRPADVTVTSSSGQTLTVIPTGSGVTVTKQAQSYSAAVQFNVPVSGTYEIAVHTSQPSEVLIAQPIGRTLRTLLKWVIPGAVGGLVVVVGIILLIVGSVRRGRARRYPGYPR